MAIQINGTSGISGVDGSAATPALQGTDTNSGISFPAADTVAINTGGSERSRVDSSGRLLVGTSSSPSAGFGQYGLLVAQGYAGNSTGSGEIAISRGQAASSITSGSGIGNINFCDNTGNTFGVIGCVADATAGSGDYPGRLVFSTTADGASSPTQRVKITNRGAFQTVADTGIDVIYATTPSAAGTAVAIMRGLRSGTAGSPGSGTDVFYVFSNGTVQNATGTYTTISDAKLKENIVDANSQWDDLKNIKIRNWNFKEETGQETHRQLGPIAQELEEVCPGLVFEVPDKDQDGNELGTTTKGVMQSVLYMKAVKALQEAMERIETLEAKVAALEAA